jgi:polyhydroxyalkanoate synthesis regulator phasin
VTNEPGDAAPQREEEVDLDLLTYGEAGVRLHEEVQAQKRLADELEQRGDPGAERARRRLEDLQKAAERNSRQPINDDNFERFFGYKGKARRNT